MRCRGANELAIRQIGATLCGLGQFTVALQPVAQTILERTGKVGGDDALANGAEIGTLASAALVQIRDRIQRWEKFDPRRVGSPFACRAPDRPVTL